MSEREHKTGPAGRGLRCDEWENLIADALDANLAATEEAAFARHASECALCAQMLKETQQGKDWMQYLAAEPEVPAGLLEKILARTSDRPASAVNPAQPAVPAGPLPQGMPGTRAARRPGWLAGRLWAQQMVEPRLLMTLAMAFFSIALTLNLTGIHLTQIRAADLQPSRLRVTLTRQYYSTNEQVTKYYENLRLVYEMEARVRELRRSSETAPAPSVNPPAPQRNGTGAPTSTVPRNPQPQPQGRRTEGEAAVALPAGYRRGLSGMGLPRFGLPRFGLPRILRALSPEAQAKRSLV